MIKVLDNVYDLVTLNMEQRFSERVALRFYDKETDEVTAVHYKDYARDIRRAVSYFQSTIPDIKGKKICLLNKNSYEYAVNTFGIILAGGVLVLLNQHKSWDELSYELGLVDPAAILTDGDDYGTKEQLQAAYGSILRPMDGFRAYEPVAEMPRCIGHDDLMILMFTSGTTGRSKGVMLSERNFFSVMRAHVQIGERMMEYKHDPELVVSQYTVLPMFHLGAFICLFSWAHGGWALNISGDIRNFYKEIRRMPSQVMAVVPVIMNSLHKDVMRGRKERLGELWVPICSSAMFDPQVMLDMATNGMFVVQTYGATETCGDGIINYAQDAKHIGAVGQGNDYLDYKLEPDGELCIRGDSIMTTSYVRICGAGIFFIVAYNMLSALFRGLGDSRSPLIFVLVACVVNIIGDLVLVAGFHLDAVGAAIATVAAQAVSVVCAVIMLLKKDLPFSIKKADFRLNFQCKKFLAIGLPLALQEFLTQLSFLALCAFVNRLGLEASSGYGVACKIVNFAMLIPSALMQSMASFISQNIGAGKHQRARQTLRTGIGIGLFFGLFVFALVLCKGDLLCSFFSGYTG